MRDFASVMHEKAHCPGDAPPLPSPTPPPPPPPRAARCDHGRTLQISHGHVVVQRAAAACAAAAAAVARGEGSAGRSALSHAAGGGATNGSSAAPTAHTVNTHTRHAQPIERARCCGGSAVCTSVREKLQSHVYQGPAVETRSGCDGAPTTCAATRASPIVVVLLYRFALGLSAVICGAFAVHARRGAAGVVCRRGQARSLAIAAAAAAASYAPPSRHRFSPLHRHMWLLR